MLTPRTQDPPHGASKTLQQVLLSEGLAPPLTQLPCDHSWQIVNPCLSSLLGPPSMKGGPAGCGCAGPCRSRATAVGPHRVRGSLAHFLAPLPNLHPLSQHSQQLCTPFSTSFSPVFLCAHSFHVSSSLQALAYFTEVKSRLHFKCHWKTLKGLELTHHVKALSVARQRADWRCWPQKQNQSGDDFNSPGNKSWQLRPTECRWKRMDSGLVLEVKLPGAPNR